MSQTMNPTNGFGVATEPSTVRLERVLPGPIEHVWAYLTDSQLRGKWLAAGAMDLRLGGQVELKFHHADLSPQPDPIPERYKDLEGGHLMYGRITQLDPPRLLGYSWSEASGEDSEVTFELTPRGNEVLFVVTHRRLPDRDAMVSVASGWHAHVDILIDRLNDRVPGGFWSNHAKLQAQYEKRLPAS